MCIRDRLLTVSQYPFARTGETITTPAVFVKLFKGDWRSGAADYKEWVQTWYTPVEKPQWVRIMAGWQRIIMKHQYLSLIHISWMPRMPAKRAASSADKSAATSDGIPTACLLYTSRCV